MNDVGLMLVSGGLALIPSVLTAVILHEVGHALLGSLGGYRCYGMILMGRVFLRTSEGTYSRRTAEFVPGRCFLVPDRDRTIPGLAVVGGCLMNLWIGGLSLYALAGFNCAPCVFGILFAMAVVNLSLGLANLICGTKTADGETLREVCRIAGAGLCYDRILRLEKLMTDGESIVDAEQDWLIVPEGCTGTLALELGIYSYIALTERYTGGFGYEYLDHRLKLLEENREAKVFEKELSTERERLEKRRRAGEKWTS